MPFGTGRIGKAARVLIQLKNHREDEGRGPMKTFRLAAAAAFLILSSAIACAQTTLRIGLAEDPDVLYPTLARTYVGRIVFASFCDKLFDIDEKLNAVPQLALGYETAPDGKAVTIKSAERQIPRRREARRGCGEILARAPHDHDRLVPQTGAGGGRSRGGRRSAHHQTGAEDAVRSADRAADRPCRHDGLAEGGKSGGRQVRIAAGLRGAVQVRRTRAAGSDRRREIRRLLEQG